MSQLNPRYEATFKVNHIIHQPSNIIHLTDECRGGFHQRGTRCRAEKAYNKNHIIHPTSDIILRSADYGIPSYIDKLRLCRETLYNSL